MQTWRIHPKTPGAAHKIWAGPQSIHNTIPASENDRHRTQREALENRLKNLLGAENVSWNRRRYFYLAELTPEQVDEIRLWPFVSGMVPHK